MKKKQYIIKIFYPETDVGKCILRKKVAEMIDDVVNNLNINIKDERDNLHTA